MKQKVVGCLNMMGVSTKLLRQIANKLTEQNLSRRFFEHATKDRFAEVRRDIVLPLAAGGEQRWAVADPNLLVALSLRTSTHMEELFARSLRLHPCSEDRPWSLVVVWDEFTPGNMLKPLNERKTMAVYFSFLELEGGGDKAWWTMAVARAPMIKKVQGGWSRMLRDLLRLSLGSPSGMQVAGIPVVVKGEFITIFARVACLLSDGDGLRQALQWNGASSLKPCFRHWNCLMKGSRTPDGYEAIDCSSSEKFKLWNEGDWRTSIDVCVEATRQWGMGEMTKAALEETQKFLGFKATQDGLLSCPELRSHMHFIDVLRYDWAHTFLADSIVGHQMWSLIGTAKGEGIFDEQTIYDFLSEPWQFPRGLQEKKGTKWNSLRMVFDAHRMETHESKGTLKASMSELLGLYGLLRHFVGVRMPDHSRMTEEVRLFKLVCKALDLLLAAKKRLMPVREAGRRLLQVLEQHMQHAKAHDSARIVPKYHWAFDIAQCMVADGFIVDAFTLERLHIRVKGVATNCKNLTCYEESVMAGCTNAHFGSLEDDERWASSCRLLGAVAAMPGAPNMFVADRCQYLSEVFAVDSFVFRGATLLVFLVWRCSSLLCGWLGWLGVWGNGEFVGRKGGGPVPTDKLP